MFGNTRWTLIEAARRGDTQALEAFAQQYRAPIVAYVRQRGLSDQAEDLAHEVFVQLLASKAMETVNPSKGRFRHLLQAITRNVIAGHLAKAKAKKRGGDRHQVPLAFDPSTRADPDELFDREWVAHLLDEVLRRLEAAHPNYHQVLTLHLQEQRPLADISAALGKPLSTIKNWMRRGRAKVKAYLQEEVWRYSNSQEDFAAELRSLARFFPERIEVDSS